uniref:Protein ALWAYS EARLY 3 isoform X2 n=1 Tax=Rhizophora mucronata TaxID=61149 RepID=A0A2P2N076_RHIMU
MAQRAVVSTWFTNTSHGLKLRK